jgi:hypothetical protein
MYQQFYSKNLITVVTGKCRGTSRLLQKFPSYELSKAIAQAISQGAGLTQGAGGGQIGTDTDFLRDVSVFFYQLSFRRPFVRLPDKKNKKILKVILCLSLRDFTP